MKKLPLLLLAVVLLATAAGPVGAERASSAAHPLQAGMIAAGVTHTCAILADGSVRCWGDPTAGDLGYGNLTGIGDNETPASAGPVNLGAGRTAVSIATGESQTCAILDNGSVRCWGLNSSGQLGYGNTSNIGDNETPAAAGPVNLGGHTALAITAGDFHTCAILDDHSVRCWGLGTEGRLGYGNTSTIGDNETPASAGPVDLGAGRTAVAISAGSTHTCAILDNGTVRCWGDGSSGALGYGNENDIGDDETPGSVGPVSLGAGRTAVAISAGGSFTCALLDNGTVRCWGDSSLGELGYGNLTDIGDNELPSSVGPVSIGAGHTAVAMEVGPDTGCVILDDGSVRCWGDGANGRLGLGNTTTIGDNELPSSVGTVSLGAGRTAVAISAGFGQTCATLDNGTLRCWGRNDLGQLGYGNTNDIGDNELPSTAGPVSLGGSMIGRIADLSLTESESSSTATVGDTVNVTVKVTNGGPDPATPTVGVTRSGAGNAIVIAVPSAGTFDTGSGLWSPGALASGASAQLVLTLQANAAGTLQVVSEVQTSSAFDPDSHPGNGAAGEDDRASVSATIADRPPPTTTETTPTTTATTPTTTATTPTTTATTPTSPTTPTAPTTTTGPETPVTPVGTTTPPPVRKAKPGGLTLGVTPARDRTAPYVFTAAGGLVLSHVPQPLTVACRGTVTLTVTAGTRTLATKRTAVAVKSGICRYKAKLAIAAAARRTAATARVTASYGGNVKLLSASSKAATVRLG